jgi:shikimate dehydrogenase
VDAKFLLKIWCAYAIFRKLCTFAAMKLFAITGNPVLHSKSPLVFGATHPTRADEFAYFRLWAQSADEAMQLFDELSLSGMNVTAPFKGGVAQLADARSHEVQVLGVANTLVCGNDGRTTCYNTDIHGVAGAFADAGVSVEGKRCVVLGAGGAGSAAAYALHQGGASVTIVNRTAERAQRLAAAIGCTSADFGELPRLIPQADIAVNALLPEVDALNEVWLNPHQVVFDAIYHASRVREKALRKGCTFIDGAGWLLHQGLPAYRMFTGLEADVTNVNTAQLTQKIPRHIALIGFMGAGKSTVAPLLAAQLNWPAAEVDAAIEKRCGMGIPQIIESRGEAYFREVEEATLAEILHSPTPHVISCGGGVVTRPALRELLKKNSIVVWLYAPPETCISRIDIASRPLLAGQKNPQQAAIEMFNQRKFAYAQTAWMLVSGKERSANEVSQIIYDELRKIIGS